MVSIKLLGIGLLTSLLFCCSSAQVIAPASAPLRPGDVSFQQIANSCEKLIVKLGLKRFSPSRLKMDLKEFSSLPRYWDCTTSPYDYSFKVSPETGAVMSFYYMSRRQDQYKRKNRTRKQFFNSQPQAKAHLSRLARVLGVPGSARMDRFEWKKDGQVKDANTAGYVGARFVDANGKLLATLTCDPQDGVLVTFSRSR